MKIRSLFLHFSVALYLASASCSDPHAVAGQAAADVTASADDVSLDAVGEDGSPGAPDVAPSGDLPPADEGVVAEFQDAASDVDAVPGSDTQAPVDTDICEEPCQLADTGASKDLVANPDSSEVVLGAEVTSGVEGCKDIRKRQDYKVMWDDCWDPPFHYCSPGGPAAMTWLGCKPGTLTCCQFPSSCIPCGWTHCSPQAKLTADQLQQCTVMSKKWETLTVTPDECLPYMPNDDPICWDGIDPVWNDKEQHKHDIDSWLTW